MGFSNFNLCKDLRGRGGGAVKCTFSFSRAGLGRRFCISDKLPGNVNAAAPQQADQLTGGIGCPGNPAKTERHLCTPFSGNIYCALRLIQLSYCTSPFIMMQKRPQLGVGRGPPKLPADAISAEGASPGPPERPRGPRRRAFLRGAERAGRPRSAFSRARRARLRGGTGRVPAWEPPPS